MNSPTSTDEEQPAPVLPADLAYPLNVDSPFAAPFLARGLPVAFFLVDVTGLSPDAVDGLIPTVLAEMAERALIPVFLTDLGDFRAFRKHDVIFECLPDVAAGANALPELCWSARLAECRALIEDKWKPQGAVRLASSDGDPS